MTRPPDTAHHHLDALTGPHRGGHRCTDGGWYNAAVYPDAPCPVSVHLQTIRGAVDALTAAPHAAAHDTSTAVAVAEGMTGLDLSALPEEEREGWTLTARLAIETLAAHLDRDPEREARAAAVHARLEAAGL